MNNPGRIARLREWLARAPATRAIFATILGVGFIAGILFWGGYHWAMELSNTETFCISCHEMEENVYREYQETIHYSNRTGVRAICSDCHVPREWQHKVVRKIKATNELFHKVMGTIDTPERFNAKRPELAVNVWRSMRSTDSRECRNCHSFVSMDLSVQDRFAKRKHQQGDKRGETCIDCHQGVAHKLPDDWKAVWNEAFEEGSKADEKEEPAAEPVAAAQGD